MSKRELGRYVPKKTKTGRSPANAGDLAALYIYITNKVIAPGGMPHHMSYAEWTPFHSTINFSITPAPFGRCFEFPSLLSGTFN